MFLSIIIPVYNAGKYLAECLDSCTQQDISPEDYEIICVNDGSADNSPEILNTYAERFGQIRVISQPNAGVSAARNAGLDRAVGEYVWFIDADDVIAPNCLKRLRETCIETGCDRLGFSMISVPEVMPSWEKRQEMIADRSVEKPTSDWGYMVLTLMRRDFIAEHRIRFLPKIAYGEDMVFNYTWDLYSYQYVKLDQVLYFYRTNPASAMQTLKTSRAAQIKRMRSIIQILLWLRENGMPSPAGGGRTKTGSGSAVRRYAGNADHGVNAGHIPSGQSGAMGRNQGMPLTGRGLSVQEKRCRRPGSGHGCRIQDAPKICF